MSTLLSRIFGRKSSKAEAEPLDNNRIDVSALKPLMSPQEFAEVRAKRGPAQPAVSAAPSELNGLWSMGQVLKEYPTAQRALFQKFHIGGCNSCGYEPADTLDKVSQSHGLETANVIAFIKDSMNLEKDLEINPADVAGLMKLGAIKLLDVRTPEEYAIAHIEGSILVDQSLAQEIVSSWPKDTAIVMLCHHGMRSLDATAYLRGHGMMKTRSMRGGMEAWSVSIDPSVPRY